MSHSAAAAEDSGNPTNLRAPGSFGSGSTQRIATGIVPNNSTVSTHELINASYNKPCTDFDGQQQHPATSASSVMASTSGPSIVQPGIQSTVPSTSVAPIAAASSASTLAPSASIAPQSSGSLMAAPKERSKVMTVNASTGYTTGSSGSADGSVEISYSDTKVIGSGSFGVVYQAKLCETGELVAIKKVLQDKRFKNRELQIMRRLDHCNIVKLLYFFYTSGEKKDDIYLNLVLEFIPETVYHVTRKLVKSKDFFSFIQIKIYMYQLFRSLAYIHSLEICHRDIKPQNLLLNRDTGVLKLCDFGSAKHLVQGEPNVSYICSRYYRAPELIFGATDYTTSIDIWSAGCVFAELLLGQPIFPGDSAVDQLVEIIKVLGTPTKEQIIEMNPKYTEFKFPLIKAHPWTKVFHSRTGYDTIELISKLLQYPPQSRILPMDALAHTFFDELRLPNIKQRCACPMPPLFNFTEAELSVNPSLRRVLVPVHLEDGGDGVTEASGNQQHSGVVDNPT